MLKAPHNERFGQQRIVLMLSRVAMEVFDSNIPPETRLGGPKHHAHPSLAQHLDDPKCGIAMGCDRQLRQGHRTAHLIAWSWNGRERVERRLTGVHMFAVARVHAGCLGLISSPHQSGRLTLWRPSCLRPATTLSYNTSYYSGISISLQALYTRSMADLFAAGSALRRFTDDEVGAIYGVGVTRELSDGETIITAGVRGDSMFIVDTGVALLELSTGTTKKLTAGHYFGELALINPDHERSASVLAYGPTRLVELDQQSLRRLYDAQPTVLLKLIRRACAFLVDKESSLLTDLRQKNQELLQTLDFLRRTREELSYQELLANTDGLTGLYNRRCFDEQLPRFMTRESSVAILMLDLDHFKPINDTFGHDAGDDVLRGVGKVIRECVRKSDLPVRFGGDEFCMVLVGVSESSARKRAEQIRLGVERLEHSASDHGPRVTATIGGALLVSGETSSSLCRRADEALYRAKRDGRNRVHWA